MLGWILISLFAIGILSVAARGIYWIYRGATIKRRARRYRERLDRDWMDPETREALRKDPLSWGTRRKD